MTTQPSFGICGITSSILLCMSFGFRVEAASLIVDSFTEGSFALGSGGLNENISSIRGDVADVRHVTRSATGNWNATLNTTAGSLIYTLSLPAEPLPGQRNQLNVIYAKAGDGIDLLGIHGVSINVTKLIGMGQFLIGLNGIGEGVPLDIIAPGLIYIPFSNTSPRLPGGRSTLALSVVAKSSNFSVTLDEISVVPEPTALLMLGMGGWVTLRRRRT